MERDFFKNKGAIKKIKDETVKEFFKQSSSWQKKAMKYINDPAEAGRLLNEAVNKASLNRSGPLNEVWDSLQTLFSLIRDWIKGDYRGIPFKALLLILAGIVYFVTPVDIIPEFIVGLGLLDDAVILGWIISQMGGELDNYRAWKGKGRVIDIEASQAD